MGCGVRVLHIVRYVCVLTGDECTSYLPVVRFNTQSSTIVKRPLLTDARVVGFVLKHPRQQGSEVR